MIVAALTGSIGMGKSTVLKMFEELGAAIWNADDAVHRLYAKGGAAVAPIKKEFSGVIANGAVDREKLAAIVFGDAARLKKLESIVHPLVAADRERFVKKARAEGAEIVILDIPLLFENCGEDAFEAVIVVSAPAHTQRARVLGRPGMSEEKFAAILARQTPDPEKRARADFVINTNQDFAATRKDVSAVMGKLKKAAKP
jgi:dephospho-CoA kinase